MEWLTLRMLEPEDGLARYQSSSSKFGPAELVRVTRISAVPPQVAAVTESL